MRVVLQRVSKASVKISGELCSAIDKGLLLFVGIESNDTEEDIEYLVQKISKLRVFDDENGVMNLSVMDIDGDIIAVSQFTLHALTKKGNRPSYIKAASPAISKPLYEKFLSRATEVIGKEVGRGVFGADMQVELINDGPVTIWIDSKNKE